VQPSLLCSVEWMADAAKQKYGSNLRAVSAIDPQLSASIEETGLFIVAVDRRLSAGWKCWRS
jgi:hypothetical protein